MILLRHGEADWAAVNQQRWPGAANDLAPLTGLGVRQAEAVAHELTSFGVTLVLSSPMTRALQTAAIVSARLDAPLKVELDLREWLPDESYTWSTAQEVAAAFEDLRRHGGARPQNHPLRWESLETVRSRAAAVLRRYRDEPTALVVSHEVLMYAVTGRRQTANCGFVVLPDGFTEEASA